MTRRFGAFRIQSERRNFTARSTQPKKEAPTRGRGSGCKAAYDFGLQALAVASHMPPAF